MQNDDGLELSRAKTLADLLPQIENKLNHTELYALQLFAERALRISDMLSAADEKFNEYENIITGIGRILAMLIHASPNKVLRLPRTAVDAFESTVFEQISCAYDSSLDDYIISLKSPAPSVHTPPGPAKREPTAN
mgnify:CR=1 FL=1